MIITRLSGGLGNQMFQYAMGRALALRNNGELALDIFSFGRPRRGETPREFALGAFNIVARTAEDRDFSNIGIITPRRTDFHARMRRRLVHLIDSRRTPGKRRFISDKTYVFSKEAYDAGRNCYLAGNWQCDRYFSDCRDIIRSDFTLRISLAGAAAHAFDKAGTTNSVSVHVRRGDFITAAHTSELHGSCSPEYYARAFALISARVSNPVWFVFSDDIPWVKAHVPMPNTAHYISAGGIADHDELIVMSHCKHNIIANSSFSWWGAWLNVNHDKIVVAPKQWFRNPNTVVSDLLPAGWISI